ncbi:MAG: Inner rane component of cytoplasmic domain [Myxococcales bacterium]|nr:Inner rane component of cytoplasmic domain [Myxococcales bacterium]
MVTQSESTFPFVVAVSLFDTPEEQFIFDQPEVMVGRCADADLHIAHPAFSRRQLTIQRIVPRIGRPRFRIVPHATTNPVLVNGIPAVEGSIVFGDVVAVAETRIVLRKARRRSALKVTPLRIALGVIGVLSVAMVTRLALMPVRPGPAMVMPQFKLFYNLPQVSCADATTCIERARTAYTHAKTYTKQAASVPGGWYHATMELYRAHELERQSGRRIAGLENVRAELTTAATSAESIYNDLQFRLARDLRANDPDALRETIAMLVLVVPDEQHPLRQKLNEYLREHPLPPKPGAKR